MPRSRRYEVQVGALVLAALALLAWMSVQVGDLAGVRDAVRVEVVLDDAAGLDEGAAVKVAGVVVGRVASIRVRDGRAVLGLAIRRDAGVRRDAAVQVRARSVLGEKYLAVLPGSPDAPPLADGDRIERVLPQVEIDEMVNRVGALLDPEVVAALGAALAEDPERVPRMLDDLEALLHNARVAAEELPGLVEDARAAVDETRALVRRARPVLERADRFVASVEEAGLAGDADALLAETRAAVSDARGVLERADRVAARVEASMDDVDAVLGNLRSLDRTELRRLLREEGVLIRLRPHRVEEPAAE